MKNSSYQTASREELQAQLKAAKAVLGKLTYLSKDPAQQTKPHEVKFLRKQVARILTALHNKN